MAEEPGYAPGVIELAKAVAAAEDVHGKTIWGVQLAFDDKAQPKPSKPQAVVLGKFLRARSNKLEDALAMLKASLKWREEFGVDKLVADGESFPQFQGCGAVLGKDKQGCPVTYNFYGGVDIESLLNSPEAVQAFIKWRVQLMEHAILKGCDFEKGVEHVMQVHDYAGASMMRMGPGIKEASRSIIRLFQDNYPEMLSTKLFLNVPRFMEFIFGVLSSFSDPATKKKFRMISAAYARSSLLEYISFDQLPERYGGSLLEQAGSSRAVTSAGEEAASEGAQAATIKPGEPHVVTVQVSPDQVPADLTWRFMAPRGKVALTSRFAEEGGPSTSSSDSGAAAQGEEFGGGSMHVEKPGKLTLVLTNANTGWLWVDPVEVHYLVAVKKSS